MNQVEVNKEAKLSPHFSLGELTRSKSHPEIYNIPSRQVIENLKRVCVWLEALRERYNLRYVLAGAGGQVPKVEVFGENFISRPDPEEEPIIITSGSEGWGSGDLESSDGVRGRYSRGGEGATDSLCVYPARLCGRDETGL